MTIMPETQGIDNTIQKCFSRFIQRFGINGILRNVNATKEKGIPTYAIFAFILGLVFTGKNLYVLLTATFEKMSYGKDVVYRFLNRPFIHWEAFVRKLSSAVVSEVKALTSPSRKTALILDDTPYYRNRSKKVEMLSRCYDHSENRYYKGFHMLTLGWSDGVTFMPVDFHMLASGSDDHLLEGSHIKDDGRTLATKRRIAARTAKPTLALEMLAAVKDTPAQTKYVLFDSWFASPSFIISVKRLGFDVVARIKNHENYRYLYDGKNQSLSQIYKANKKRRGMSRYLLAVSVHVRHDDFPEMIPATIVYVRDKSNRKKWLAFISTDTTLSADETIALYGKRWDIEPFHKVIKSHLRLTKEFQLRSFDAITAHTAIVLTRYIFLSLENRECADERSIGMIFLAVCRELDDISFQYAFHLICSTFSHCLSDYFLLSKAQVSFLVNQFISRLPCFIKHKLRLVVCES